MPNPEKSLFWIGSAKRDLMAFPDDVKDLFGYALHLAQHGEKHIDAKPLKAMSMYCTVSRRNPRKEYQRRSLKWT